MAGDGDHCRDVHTGRAMCIARCEAMARLPDARRFNCPKDRPHPGSVAATHAAARP